MLQGKRILLIVSGGIAAYKALDLIRRLRERGASVRCALTRGGAEFVTPLSLAALSEDTVYTDLFSLTTESEMGHIRLSREADLLLVAPATADILAKMAAGLADDIATTALLATDKPVMVVPAMNVRMWEHAATRMLTKYLGYDLGQEVPAVREELVEYVLAHDGDLRALAFAVLTSLPYRQTTNGADSAPLPYAYGPLKQTEAEGWVESVARIAGRRITFNLQRQAGELAGALQRSAQLNVGVR